MNGRCFFSLHVSVLQLSCHEGQSNKGQICSFNMREWRLFNEGIRSAAICGSICSSQTRLLSFSVCIYFGDGEALRSGILVLGLSKMHFHLQREHSCLIGEMIPKEVICEVWPLHQHSHPKGPITWPTMRNNATAQHLLLDGLLCLLNRHKHGGYGLWVSLELCTGHPGAVSTRPQREIWN